MSREEKRILNDPTKENKKKTRREDLEDRHKETQVKTCTLRGVKKKQTKRVCLSANTKNHRINP